MTDEIADNGPEKSPRHEAGDKTDADRVLGNGKNNWDSRDSRLRCRRRWDSST